MTRLNLDQMATFLAVVRQGGVRRAADALHLTQPAVTARVKALEKTFGCALFERTPKGMTLTRRGELLLAHAERLEDLAHGIERDVIAPDVLEGRLRLGVSETIAQSWLPELIARLHGAYPRLEIEFNVDISSALRSSLLDREIDLAILLGPVSEASVENALLPAFDLAWYAAAGAGGTPKTLLRRPVLTYARHTRPYREVKRLIRDRVGPEVPLFPSTSLSACFRLVAADLGVAALPRALGREWVAAGQIREFDPGWVPSPLQFTASWLDAPQSHLIDRAVALAQDVASGDKIY